MGRFSEGVLQGGVRGGSKRGLFLLKLIIVRVGGVLFAWQGGLTRILQAPFSASREILVWRRRIRRRAGLPLRWRDCRFERDGVIFCARLVLQNECFAVCQVWKSRLKSRLPAHNGLAFFMARFEYTRSIQPGVAFSVMLYSGCGVPPFGRSKKTGWHREYIPPSRAVDIPFFRQGLFF